jgi:hypothetical protein
LVPASELDSVSAKVKALVSAKVKASVSAKVKASVSAKVKVLAIQWVSESESGSEVG